MTFEIIVKQQENITTMCTGHYLLQLQNDSVGSEWFSSVWPCLVLQCNVDFWNRYYLRSPPSLSFSFSSLFSFFLRAYAIVTQCTLPLVSYSEMLSEART